MSGPKRLIPDQLADHLANLCEEFPGMAMDLGSHIAALEEELVQAEAAVRSLLEVTEHGSNRGPVFDARVEAYAFIRRHKSPPQEDAK